MFKKIDHVELTPGNMERTMAFYTDVLGFTVKSRKKMDRPPMEEIAFLQLGDTTVEFVAMTNPAPPARGPQVGYRGLALEVDDMDKTIAYLKSKGIEATVAPVSLGTSVRAEINDPDGLMIELRQWL